MLRIASWSARTASAVAFVFLLALAAVPGGASAQGVGLVAVGYGEGGYEYLQVGYGGGPASSSPATTPPAGPSAPPRSARRGPCGCNYNGNIQTAWDVNTDLLVRKAVALPPGATNVVISGTVDNNASRVLQRCDRSAPAAAAIANQGAINAAVPDCVLAADGNNLLGHPRPATTASRATSTSR